MFHFRQSIACPNSDQFHTGLEGRLFFDGPIDLIEERYGLDAIVTVRIDEINEDHSRKDVLKGKSLPGTDPEILRFRRGQGVGKRDLGKRISVFQKGPGCLRQLPENRPGVNQDQEKDGREPNKDPGLTSQPLDPIQS
jgi:hypothetical protein